MSLRAFHLFFIFVATLFSLGFGCWAIYYYTRVDDVAYVVMGIISLLCFAALVGYGRWFLIKMKGVTE